MQNTQERTIPSLTLFYQNGLHAVSVAEDECSICYSAFETDGDNVSVDPCKHVFHRDCIVKWCKTQLLAPGGTRNRDCDYGTCPYDRIQLFHANGMSAQEINMHSWVQSLYGLKGTQFEAIGRKALARIQSSSDINVELVDEVVDIMIEEDAAYEPIAIEQGVRQSRPLPLTMMSVVTLFRLQRNESLRGDVAALRITANQLVGAGVPGRDGFDWIATIEPIWQAWQASGYPRCDYITMSSLHRLVICAMLVAEFAIVDPNTISYAQLLAHGERLLLEAQQRVASGSLTPRWLREHYRVLDWTPTAPVDPQNRSFSSQNVGTLYPYNVPRVQWIVRLRTLTRGPAADPLVP